MPTVAGQKIRRTSEGLKKRSGRAYSGAAIEDNGDLGPINIETMTSIQLYAQARHTARQHEVMAKSHHEAAVLTQYLLYKVLGDDGAYFVFQLDPQDIESAELAIQKDRYGRR